ncbi:MAG: hypothetical protein ACTSPY_17300, partial [Candidatus Helarchaeota archaeon]
FLDEIIKEHVIIMTEVEDWKEEFLKIIGPKDIKNIPIEALKGLTPEQLKEILKDIPLEQLKEILKDILPE